MDPLTMPLNDSSTADFFNSSSFDLVDLDNKTSAIGQGSRSKEGTPVFVTRNIMLGILGMIFNLAGVLLLSLTKKVKSSLKITLISFALNDFVFTSTLFLYGLNSSRNERMCWATVYALITTLVISFCTALFMSVHNFIAVFYPFKCNILFNNSRVSCIVVGIWIYGACFTLGCIGVNPKIEYGCFPLSIIPKSGLIIISFNPVVTTLFVVVLNILIFMKVRARKNKIQSISASVQYTSEARTSETVQMNVSKSKTKYPCRRNNQRSGDSFISAPHLSDLKQRKTTRKKTGPFPKRGKTNNSTKNEAIFKFMDKFAEREQHRRTQESNIENESPLSEEIIRGLVMTRNNTATVTPKFLINKSSLRAPQMSDGFRAKRPDKEYNKHSEPTLDIRGEDLSSSMTFKGGNEKWVYSEERRKTPMNDIKVNSVTSGAHSAQRIISSSIDNNFPEQGIGESTSGSSHMEKGIVEGRKAASIKGNSQLENSDSLIEENIILKSPKRVLKEKNSNKKSHVNTGNVKYFTQTEKINKPRMSEITPCTSRQYGQDEYLTDSSPEEARKEVAFTDNSSLVDVKGKERPFMEKSVVKAASTTSIAENVIIVSPPPASSTFENWSKAAPESAESLTIQTTDENNATNESFSENTLPSSSTPTSKIDHMNPQPQKVKKLSVAKSIHLPQVSSVSGTLRRMNSKTRNTLVLLSLSCCFLTSPYVIIMAYVRTLEPKHRQVFATSDIGIFLVSLIMVNSLSNPFLYAWRFIDWPHVKFRIRKWLRCRYTE